MHSASLHKRFPHALAIVILSLSLLSAMVPAGVAGATDKLSTTSTANHGAVNRHNKSHTMEKLSPEQSTGDSSRRGSVTVPAFTPKGNTAQSWQSLGPAPTLPSVANGNNGFFNHSFGYTAGRVTTLAIVTGTTAATNTLYAGTQDGGVWKSTDSGTTWFPTMNGLVFQAIGAIAVDPNNSNIIYAGTGEYNFNLNATGGEGIYKSVDAGATWVLMGQSTFTNYNTGTGEGFGFMKLVVDPNNSQHIYAGANFGLYVSQDGGTTWNEFPAGNGFKFVPVSDILVDTTTNPSHVIAAVGDSSGGFSATPSGLYISLDGGTTFNFTTPYGTGYPTGRAAGRTSIAQAPSNKSVYYMITEDTVTDASVGVWRSNNSGLTWVQVTPAQSAGGPNLVGNQGGYDMYIRVDPTNADTVYVGGVDIWKSTNGSASTVTFTNLTDVYGNGTTTTAHPDEHEMVFAGSSDIFVGNDGGVYNSTDSGATWNSVNGQLDITEFYGGSTTADFNASKVVYAGAQDNGNQKYSGNQMWTSSYGGDGGYTATDPHNANVTYEEYVYLTINKSTDGGVNYSRVTNGINSADPVEFIAPFIMDLNNANHLLAGTNRIYETLNGATNWVAISPALSRNGDITYIAIAASDSRVVYAGTSDGRVWMTRNANTGAMGTWKEITTGLVGVAGRRVSSISVNQNNAQDVVVTFKGYANSTATGIGKHVFRSSTGGVSWNDISTNLPDIQVNSILRDPRNSNLFYVGADDGFYLTSDGGASWYSYQNGLPRTAINQIFADANFTTLLIATKGRGVWSLPANVIGSASSLSLSGVPASVTAGSPFNFTVTLKDSSGNVATGYTGTVHFSSSDTQAALPFDYTFIATDASVRTFSAALKKSGAQTLTATDTANASLTATSNVTVNAAKMSGFVINGLPAVVTAGVSINFTVQAVDAYGNTITGYTGTVGFSSSDTIASVTPSPYTFVAADNGQHTFNVTLKTLGTQTLTVIDQTTPTLQGTATTNVTNATLTSISVTPANPSIAKGTSQQFVATGTYSDGSTQDLTSIVTWSSSNTTVATISNSSGSRGLATALNTGTSQISAMSGSITANTTLTVTAATLKSIAVTPVAPAIAKGTTQQFTAIGTFSDGTIQDLSSQASWTSSSTAVATISASGLASGLSGGATTITATFSGVSGNATLNVTDAVLQSIVVTPTTPSIARGTTQQFVATGTYSDGSTQNLTSSVNWTSATTTVAKISNSSGSRGLATAVAVGTSQISATSGTVSGSATLTVTAATLNRIAVTPAAPAIARGTTQQFTAIGTFSDGSTQDLSTQASWTSSSTTVATINTVGLASGLTSGATTIKATFSGISGTASLNVTNASLTGISVTPASPSIAKGTAQQFVAIGTYSDGTTQDITSIVTWSSATTTVATISNSNGSRGLATALSVGSTTITATSGTVSGSATLTVTAATLNRIVVTPVAPAIAKGMTQQFTAIGTFSDGSTQDLSTQTSWTSSSTAVATINTAGLASGLTAGATTITATFSGVSGTATLNVTNATLQSLKVTPATATINAVTNAQFTAVGTFSDGSTQDLTSSVVWTATNTAVATISNAPGSYGLATGRSVGTAMVVATFGTISGKATLTVTSALPVSITASAGTPQSAPLNTAFAIALQAKVKDSAGNPLAGVNVTFSAPTSGPSGTFAGGSTTATVATDANGLAPAPQFTANNAPGNYNVTASVGSLSTTFALQNVVNGRSYYLPYYDAYMTDSHASDWLIVSNPNTTTTTVNISIGGQAIYSGAIQPGANYIQAFAPSTKGGPVIVSIAQGLPLIVSQRTLTNGNFEETSAILDSALSAHQYLPWFDTTFMQTVLYIANPNATKTATVNLTLSGVTFPGMPLQIAPLSVVTTTFVGQLNGPVELTSVSAGTSTPQPVVMTARSTYGTSNQFNEVVGTSASALSSDYLWTWWDSKITNNADWLLIGNPSANAVQVNVTIAGQAQQGFRVGAHSTAVQQYPGIMGGLVRVQAVQAGTTTPAQVFASQRTLTYGTFEEVPGTPTKSLSGEYYFTYYDSIINHGNDWILVANPSASQSVQVNVTVGTNGVSTQTVPPNSSAVFIYTSPEIQAGPVHIVATVQGTTTRAPVLVSQRVLQPNSAGQYEFNEVMGIRLQ